jgi:hypothetical protein
MRGRGPIVNASGTAPAPNQNEGSPHCEFRGSITRLLASLSTPRGGGCPPLHARLASGCWPQLCRTGFDPQGFYERFLSVTTLPPLTSFLGARFVSARQFFGLDISSFAVELAKVTMMIARKLAIDELHITEHALPLDNLDANFKAADALIDEQGNPAVWPRADVIIGNPPFSGAKNVKPERGAPYVNAVRRAYPDIPGMADYCVYWFRKAHAHLPPCIPHDPVVGRAGLVGTQNIRNNKSRIGGLDHIVLDGSIVDAVNNQPWSGDGKVHVSIVNWVRSLDRAVLPDKRRLWFEVDKKPTIKVPRPSRSGPIPTEYQLSFVELNHINSSLSSKTDVSKAKQLQSNRQPQCVFQGVTPGYSGFVLTPNERLTIVQKDSTSRKLIRPYLIGRELVTGKGNAQRYLIDAYGLTIIDLGRFAAIRKHLEDRVLMEVKDKIEEAKRTKELVQNNCSN